MNKVVVRYQDGRLLKGFTGDFFPNKDFFHLALDEGGQGAKPVEVRTADLKAVFFVKDFRGNPQHEERRAFDGSRAVVGRKIQVMFKDGEQLLGTTQGYQPGRPGFFIVPADGQSNIERCYVISAATKAVSFA